MYSLWNCCQLLLHMYLLITTHCTPDKTEQVEWLDNTIKGRESMAARVFIELYTHHSSAPVKKYYWKERVGVDQLIWYWSVCIWTHHVNHVAELFLCDKVVVRSILLPKVRPPSGVASTAERQMRQHQLPWHTLHKSHKLEPTNQPWTHSTAGKFSYCIQWVGNLWKINMWSSPGVTFSNGRQRMHRAFH